jgi:hypothetical protein
VTTVTYMRGQVIIILIQAAFDRFLKCAPAIGQSTRLTESTLEL